MVLSSRRTTRGFRLFERAANKVLGWYSLGVWDLDSSRADVWRLLGSRR